jgi:hypothetical protein
MTPKAMVTYPNNPSKLTFVYGPFVEFDIYVDPHAENIYSLPMGWDFGYQKQLNPAFIGNMQSWGAMMALMLASAFKPAELASLCPYAMNDGATQ